MKLTLQSKSHLISNIWSFVFEPADPLTWTAGQFIRVELPHPHPDAEGTRRFFTVASSPYELHIQISTRLTGTTFKRALAALEPGGTLNLVDQPAGDFVWTASAKPLVFIAQGIGITPFRSILRQRAHEGLPLTAHLFYTNRGRSIPFKSELDDLARSTQLEVTHLQNAVTPAILAGALHDLSARTVYVSGPHSLIGLLTPPYNLPAGQLRQDFFPGYTSENY